MCHSDPFSVLVWKDAVSPGVIQIFLRSIMVTFRPRVGDYRRLEETSSLYQKLITENNWIISVLLFAFDVQALANLASNAVTQSN